MFPLKKMETNDQISKFLEGDLKLFEKDLKLFENISILYFHFMDYTNTHQLF
jgi:hypothetical protein